MKNLKFLLIALIVFSCKEKSREDKVTQAPELSVLEEIANAHGFENWKNVNEIRFTFNVDRDTLHFERSWIWDTKNQKVTHISEGDSTTYFRKAVDSTLARIDAGFINDKYWLLAPYNLVWDQNSFSYELQQEATAPISQKSMNKLTIVYGNEGGYTPGDAYDFYFEDDQVIREWVFRRGNQAEPSTQSTWEDYENIGGLMISKMHRGETAGSSLYFTGLQVN